jgi:hypothetical protein
MNVLRKSMNIASDRLERRNKHVLHNLKYESFD